MWADEIEDEDLPLRWQHSDEEELGVTGEEAQDPGENQEHEGAPAENQEHEGAPAENQEHEGAPAEDQEHEGAPAEDAEQGVVAGGGRQEEDQAKGVPFNDVKQVVAGGGRREEEQLEVRREGEVRANILQDEGSKEKEKKDKQSSIREKGKVQRSPEQSEQRNDLIKGKYLKHLVYTIHILYTLPTHIILIGTLSISC